MLDAIRPYWALIRLALCGALLAIAYAWGHDHGAAHVQRAWDAADRVVQAARAKRIESARAAQDRLQAEADRERKEAHDRETALRQRADDLARRLRERPSRPGVGATVPEPAGPGPGGGGGCTGADLYRDDGEFLVRYATTAALIRDQRDQCYANYRRAQARIRELNGEATR